MIRGAVRELLYEFALTGLENDGQEVEDRQKLAPSEIRRSKSPPVPYLWPTARLHAEVRTMPNLLPPACAAWSAPRRG